MNTIERIHESNSFGIIVECGTGSVISNALYLIPGASKTIFESKQPYNKEVQVKYYGNQYDRSVSKEFIEQVLNIELNNLPENGNFVLATSFQVSDTNSSILTHGWIGYANKLGHKFYYHFSLPFNGNRKNFLDEIENIGINLLASHSLENHSFSSIYNDIVYDKSGQNISYTLSTALMGNDDENFIVSTPNGLIRFEDLVRGKPGIILQKGTYNPIHEGHIELMQQSQQQFPEHASAFLVSIKKYDKADADFNDILKLIEKVNSLGHNIIICKKPLFKENINWIQQRWNKLEIIFPVGMDTINRIVLTELADFNDYLTKLKDKNPKYNMNAKLIEYFEVLCNYAYSNTKFFVFKRKGYAENMSINLFKGLIIYNKIYNDSGISSTKIRTGEIINKI